RFFREYRDLAEVTMRDLTLVSAEMRAWMRDMRRRQILRIQEMVRQGQARGEVRTDLDPELAAIMVAGVLAGLGHLAVWSPEEPDLAGVAEKAASLVFDGLGQPGLK
ncbi:MAG: TetR family transcriptional regulator C-terminal domain-containing protein, partial [Syntrophomonadaceae bacterium]|nr:TetR family transcriptional regulator C-terminal domain-containing protein [Syntrophomonadaceae bacterium]